MLPPSSSALTVTTAAPHQMMTNTEAKTSDFCSYGANQLSSVASMRQRMSGPHRSQFFSVSMFALRGLSTHIILLPTMRRSRMIVSVTGSSSVPRSGPKPVLPPPDIEPPTFIGALKSPISNCGSAATASEPAGSAAVSAAGAARGSRSRDVTDQKLRGGGRKIAVSTCLER